MQNGDGPSNIRRDIVRYAKGSKTHSIEPGNMHGSSESALKENLVCAKKQTESQGVTLYRGRDQS